MKKNKRKRIIILSVVGAVLLLGAIGYFQMRARLDERGKTSYEIVGVQRGNIEVKVKGAGIVEPLIDNTVYAGFAGKVKEVCAKDGDIVKADDIIAVFESGALDEKYDALKTQVDEADKAIMMMRGASGSKSVVSPVKGAVKAVYGKKGDMVDAVVERFGALAVISPDGLMETVIKSSAMSAGDKVTVTVGTKSEKGTVISAIAGKAAVRFKDDGFALGDNAMVFTEDGAEAGNGDVNVANPIYVTAKGGIIDRVHKNAGSSISRGGKLFSLSGDILSGALYTQIRQRQSLADDLDRVVADLESLTVRAGTDGVVSGLSLNNNKTVQEGTALFTVKSSELIKIDVQIDELDIAAIKLGEEASVEFDALPDRVFKASVVKINPVGVSVNNVTNYTVTLTLESAAEVMLGMSADVEIIARRAEGVLLIPIEAIQSLNGDKYVVLGDDVDANLSYTPATHKVETGITDGVNIEITEGLNETDSVAVPRVKSLSLQQQMWNFRPGRDGNFGSSPAAS